MCLLFEKNYVWECSIVFSMFEYVQCSKHNIRVRLMFNNTVFDPSLQSFPSWCTVTFRLHWLFQHQLIKSIASFCVYLQSSLFIIIIMIFDKVFKHDFAYLVPICSTYFLAFALRTSFPLKMFSQLFAPFTMINESNC